MGLEEVKEEILSKAKREGDLIIKKMEAEAQKIIAEAEKRVKEIESKNHMDAERAAETLERKEIAKANFETKKRILQKKEDLIGAVFEKAASQIQKLPAEKNKAYFETLQGKASKQIGISTLYINQRDKNLAKDYKWLGTDISGGFIAETEDKSMRIDYSYDAFLDNVKNRNLSGIVNLVFK